MWQAFLRVAPRPLLPLRETTRQTRAPLRDGIANYEELRYAFSHTALAGCFNEDDV
jgi:hypothetical protein